MKALAEKEVQERFKQLEGWELTDGKELRKRFQLPDFAHAMIFVSSVGWLAESANRYRDIHFEIQWSRVILRLQTRQLEALSENDFILAEKIDGLPSFIFI